MGGSATFERMLGVDTIALGLGCSRRWLEIQRAAGRFPKPDAMVGRHPRWNRATIDRWMAESAKAAK